MYLAKIYLLLIMLLSSSSCIKSCQKNVEDNSVNIDIAQPIEALDPRYATSAIASRVAKLIYAPLFELGEDLSPKPFLADSIKAIDEKNFIITLKPNLYFHDGSILTAEDVVYTFNELISEDVNSPHGEKFAYIEKLSALDEHKLELVLKRPHAPFLTDLCALGIVSKKSCAGRSKECRHEYNGSGPYKVAKWDTAKESIKLIPFPKWFEGKPLVSLNIQIVRDENARTLALISKKTDIVYGDISSQSIIELKKYPHLAIDQVPGLGYSYLGINVRGVSKEDDSNSKEYKTKLALSNKDVRLAIAKSIDFAQIIDKLLLGSAQRVSGLIPNGHWSKDESLKPPSYDVSAAEALLDKAGFLRSKEDNMRFRLTIATTPNRLRQNIAQIYADFLKKVGIDASVRIKEWSALYEDMKKGQFEIFSAIWTPVTDPDLYYFVHHSASIPSEEHFGGNRHGYKNDDIDQLIELGRSTMEAEKRKIIYQEIEKKMLEDLPYIPLWNEDNIMVFNKNKITSLRQSKTGSLLFLRQVTLTSMR